MISRTLNIFLEPFVAVFLVCAAIVARFQPKKIDIGLGPLPLINNIYHKKVFEHCGYTAETFVNQVWHITSDFDVRSDNHPCAKIPVIGTRINTLRFVVWSLFRYRCILIYFNGGILGVTNTKFLWKIEPLLFLIANIKTIVLAYGGDVQEMSRSPNLLFKDAMSKDYPLHRFTRTTIANKIDLWTKHASHVVGGCEWVDYMHHWDTLMISHFSIDTDDWRKNEKTPESSTKSLRILHAPNHRNIKGTHHIITAIEELKTEGYDLELIILEKVANQEVRSMIQSVDVVIDQLVIGWYAMFAIEAMSLEKPVVCYLRKDLEDLYRSTGLFAKLEDIPIINATTLNFKEVLINLYNNKESLPEIGRKSREYVVQHHSVEAIAITFSRIGESLLGPPRSK